MAEITAALVKELRDKTNAGMMDCKAALKETNGDMEAAIDWLRLKGISRGGNKGDRDAKEGVIHALISDDTKVGVLLEVCCETDFVAKNDDFRGFVSTIRLVNTSGTMKKHVASAMPQKKASHCQPWPS